MEVNKDQTLKRKMIEIKMGKTPEYMETLNRKQFNAIMKTNNHQFRFCRTEVETQGYILQECPEMKIKPVHVSYNKPFRESVDELKK